MADRRAYPSDLSDARWELIEPVLTAWRFERRGRALDFGRPPEHDLREIMNAILYVDRTGVQWRYLPHDLPNWNTVYGYFAKWQADGIFAQLNGLLRELVRQQEGRNAKPSACVIDAQSVKTSTSVPAATQGTDNAKKIVGRKRSIVTDTLGLLLAVLVTAADVQDSVAGTPAARPGRRRPARHPQDLGRRRLPQHFVEHAATLGIDMEITARTPVPGWPYSVVAALETGRTSWTAVLDAVRLEPGADVAAVTTVQIREVIGRLVAAGWPALRDPRPAPFRPGNAASDTPPVKSSTWPTPRVAGRPSTAASSYSATP